MSAANDPHIFPFSASVLPKGTTVKAARELFARHGYEFRPGRFGFIGRRSTTPKQRA